MADATDMSMALCIHVISWSRLHNSVVPSVQTVFNIFIRMHDNNYRTYTVCYYDSSAQRYDGNGVITLMGHDVIILHISFSCMLPPPTRTDHDAMRSCNVLWMYSTLSSFEQWRIYITMTVSYVILLWS